MCVCMHKCVLFGINRSSISVHVFVDEVCDRERGKCKITFLRKVKNKSIHLRAKNNLWIAIFAINSYRPQVNINVCYRLMST